MINGNKTNFCKTFFISNNLDWSLLKSEWNIDYVLSISSSDLETIWIKVLISDPLIDDYY